MVLEKLGPFKIGRVLGHGGMGAVYEGIHETEHVAVAIKVLSDSFNEDTEVRVRFETEIETLKRLRHPNIVRLSGFGAEQGQLYYVMELVDGSSLQQELRKKRQFQWYEVAKIGIEICQALRHAHDRGIIHRDIKPANILLDQKGNVKLSDFGIARFFGSQQITDIHSVIGTLEYMSPEQALANPIQSSTDLYSLGCVLYALLMGKPPFPARSLPELLRKHNTITPLSIGSVRHDVPDELGYIIADMLQTRPEDRPRNAALVTKQLQSLLQALIGDPAEINVLPVASETPKPLPPPSEGKVPTEEYDSGSVVDLGKVTGSEVPDRILLRPQNESRADSLKHIGTEHIGTEHIGTEHPAVIFPANIGSNEAERAQRTTPLTETVTGFATSPPGGLRHGNTVADSRVPVVSPTPPPASDPPKEGNRSSARFTAVTDFNPFEEESHTVRPMFSLPMVLASTMLMLIGLTVYYLLQPVPPDVLYVRIAAAIREGEPADGYSLSQLRSAQNNIEQFLAHYPDHPSAEQIRGYQDELGLLEHERRLERRMQFSTLRSLSPVERTYISVLTSSPHDPDEMIDKLRAFIAVFQTVRSSKESVESQRRTASPVEICVELARRRLKKLEQDAAEINAEQEQVIRRRLDEAADWDALDPKRAEGIRRGIIELYQNHRWAKELVKEAQQLLEATEMEH